MFDYSAQIEIFRNSKVRLNSIFKDKLLAHRKANRDRLKSRLSSLLPRTSIGDSNFKPQGSVAMGTVIQTKFEEEEYDIDDGIVIPKSQLKDEHGVELTHTQVREIIKKSLEDGRFKKQPQIFTNCIRVFYAEEDKEKHHVDFPVYRKWTEDNGDEIKELASENSWVASDPTQVNSWFNKIVEDRNRSQKGRGTQFRQLVQLTKRFCRSREDWLDLMPNGLKLTMLIAECQPDYNARIDTSIRILFENIINRLDADLTISNLAHPNKPLLTRSSEDENVKELLNKLTEALNEIESLDDHENNTLEASREVWDWIFQSEGFFDSIDDTLVEIKKSLEEQFNVSWKEPLPWELEESYFVTLSAQWSETKHGGKWHSFSSSGPALNKNVYLKFLGDTNTPKPYQVYWQVVNTGTSAFQAKDLRGEITASSSAGAGGLMSTTVDTLREEQTSYSGKHWVECFIVKEEVCVARSKPFIVNVY